MIRISNEKEFKRLLKALADDIVDAHIHYRLYRDLIAAIEQFPLVAPQSNTFWSTTLKAHLGTSVATLARAYDTDQKSLHLPSFLQTIKANPELFTEEKFRSRKQGNVNLEELASENRIPTANELDQDINLCSPKDPLVQKLCIHRGATIAHKNARNAATGRSIAAEHPLTFEDFEVLLRRALYTLNRYSQLFEANSYSPRPVGAQDFTYIFESVTSSVEKSSVAAEQEAQTGGSKWK